MYVCGRQQQCSSRQVLIDTYKHTQTNASRNSVSGLIIEVKTKASAHSDTYTITQTGPHPHECNYMYSGL